MGMKSLEKMLEISRFVFYTNLFNVYSLKALLVHFLYQLRGSESCSRQVLVYFLHVYFIPHSILGVYLVVS